MGYQILNILDSDEACNVIEITSNGGTKAVKSWYLGWYVKQNRLENGRATYKTGTDNYLWFSPNNNWIVRKLTR